MTRAAWAWPSAYAAWQTGITRFDACLAGHWRLPPRARRQRQRSPPKTWNTCCSAWGVTTGVDVPALLALRHRVAGWLAGETLHGALWQAGLPRHAQPTLAAVV